MYEDHDDYLLRLHNLDGSGQADGELDGEGEAGEIGDKEWEEAAEAEQEEEAARAEPY